MPLSKWNGILNFQQILPTPPPSLNDASNYRLSTPKYVLTMQFLITKAYFLSDKECCSRWKALWKVMKECHKRKKYSHRKMQSKTWNYLKIFLKHSMNELRKCFVTQRFFSFKLLNFSYFFSLFVFFFFLFCSSVCRSVAPHFLLRPFEPDFFWSPFSVIHPSFRMSVRILSKWEPDRQICRQTDRRTEKWATIKLFYLTKNCARY